LSRPTWREAVANIKEITSPATTRQHQLALAAGIELPKTLPQLIARERLRAAFANDLHITIIGSDDPVSEAQQDLITSLQNEEHDNFMPVNSNEASAWIDHLRLKKR
jgi:hypothetical protein